MAAAAVLHRRAAALVLTARLVYLLTMTTLAPTKSVAKTVRYISPKLTAQPAFSRVDASLEAFAKLDSAQEERQSPAEPAKHALRELASDPRAQERSAFLECPFCKLATDHRPL